jgi:hypothetical protein
MLVLEMGIPFFELMKSQPCVQVSKVLSPISENGDLTLAT